jgi:hypothetical protein
MEEEDSVEAAPAAASDVSTAEAATDPLPARSQTSKRGKKYNEVKERLQAEARMKVDGNSKVWKVWGGVFQRYINRNLTKYIVCTLCIENDKLESADQLQ